MKKIVLYSWAMLSMFVLVGAGCSFGGSDRQTAHLSFADSTGRTFHASAGIPKDWHVFVPKSDLTVISPSNDLSSDMDALYIRVQAVDDAHMIFDQRRTVTSTEFLGATHLRFEEINELLNSSFVHHLLFMHETLLFDISYPASSAFRYEYEQLTRSIARELMKR